MDPLVSMQQKTLILSPSNFSKYKPEYISLLSNSPKSVGVLTKKFQSFVFQSISGSKTSPKFLSNDSGIEFFEEPLVINFASLIACFQ